MKVGGRNIVGGGTIVTNFGDSVVELNFENLDYRLIFLTSTQAPGGAQIVSEVLGNRLDLKLTNFDNTLGVAWFGEVGSLSGNRKLYLSLMVHAIGEGDRIARSIGYTFSTEVT